VLLALAGSACGGSELELPADRVAARIAIVRGDGQSGTVGTVLPESLVVRVTDAQDRPVSNQTVVFSVLAGGGQVIPTTVQTNADGVAAAAWMLGSGAGAQQVRAQPTGDGAPADLSVVFGANAGSSAATELIAVQGDNQTATAGSALLDSLVVRVRDASGNAVGGVNVGWSVTGGGSVSAASTVTGSDGRAAVRRILGGGAGAQTTIATAAGLIGSPVTFTASATVGSAGRLTITTQPPATAQSGVAFSQAPQVQLRDSNGNPLAQGNFPVVVTLASGPDGGNLIGSTTGITDGGGVATFAGLGLSGPSGSYTLNFTGSGLVGVTSSPVAIGAGSASRLALLVPPSGSASSGVPLEVQPQIQLQDANGNAVAQSGVQVTVTLASGGPALSGGLTASTNDAGVAIFSNLAITGATGPRTLIFAASGLSGVTSGTITVGSGPASGAQSSFSLSSGTITASSGGSAATVTITARDASGNPIAGAAVTVAADGTDITQPAATGANGQTTATISSTQAGSKTVTVSINGVAISNPSSASLVVVPAAPSATKSTATAAPASVAVLQPSTITVTVRDDFDNPIPGATVTLSATNGANVGQPTAPTNADGIATGTVSSPLVGSTTVTARIDNSVDVAQTPTVTVGLAATTTAITSQTPTVTDGDSTCVASLSAGVGSCD
jgi:hypothetical protein